MKQHKITKHSAAFPPAYVANGLIGLRIGKNPLTGNTTLLDGYYGLHEMERIESLEAAPYPLSGDICLNGLWISERPDLLALKEQIYDFSCGELTTKLEFKANGITVRIAIVTFCSRTQPTLALQEVRVSVSNACKLVMRAGIDPAGLPGRCIHRLVPNQGWRIADGSLLIESQGAVTQCGAAYITEFAGAEGVQPKRDFWGHLSATNTDYTIPAKPRKEYVLHQYASLVAGPAQTQPDQDAIRLARIGQHHGFAELRDDNRAAWAELWKGRVKVLGAGSRWQDITDAAFFYLHTSVHPSERHSTPCFGLGYRQYQGTLLWDTEVFMFPAVVLAQPRAARAMLEHRIRTVEAGRRKAALHGHDGILFGCGGRLGEEMTPSWAATVFLEQHFNLGVAKAFLQYIYATGDLLFAQRQALPVIEGVADWIVSRVTKTSRGYEIRHFTGPDEGIENVHNNAYANLLARQLLREATALAIRLGYTPPARWAEVADGIVLPVDRKSKALLKHDNYVYKGVLYNPETLLALFPHACEVEPSMRRAMIDHDLPFAKGYIGMPMFAPFFATLAAQDGDRALAAELLDGGIAGYIVEPFMSFAEYKPGTDADRAPQAAPYMATAGGYLMSCLYGFSGLELNEGEPSSWRKYPVSMPKGWEGIEVDRVFVHGKTARLSARQGDKLASLDFTSDEA